MLMSATAIEYYDHFIETYPDIVKEYHKSISINFYYFVTQHDISDTLSFCKKENFLIMQRRIGHKSIMFRNCYILVAEIFSMFYYSFIAEKLKSLYFIKIYLKRVIFLIKN